MDFEPFVDRTGWGPGPWDGEPDKVQWTDQYTGYPCLALRHPHGGHWCGYVGVPKSHPLYGIDYERLSDLPDDVHGATHGGINFASPCQEGPINETVCHVTDGPDDTWWYGYDCHHAWDYGPGTEARMRELYEVLRVEKPELYEQHMQLERMAQEHDTLGMFRQTYKTLGYVETANTELALALRTYQRERDNGSSKEGGSSATQARPESRE